jgi:hypothetical protein
MSTERTSLSSPVLRGRGYQASILCALGRWLLGPCLLLTLGADNKAFSPDAVGWYAVALIVLAIGTSPAEDHSVEAAAAGPHPPVSTPISST